VAANVTDKVSAKLITKEVLRLSGDLWSAERYH